MFADHSFFVLDTLAIYNGKRLGEEKSLCTWTRGTHNINTRRLAEANSETQ